ncbi:hypothetical protein D8L93_01535 [Sodalis-like symbiont of Bactericera trigonica]|nr:hypothetical protein D8L93_01535 [Sodalis-like symbiont of Bactericera trigonica]
MTVVILSRRLPKSSIYLTKPSYDDKSHYVGIISLDTANNDDLIYYNAEKLHQVVNFDRIIGVREFDLLPAAYLRAQWGLPGTLLGGGNPRLS